MTTQNLPFLDIPRQSCGPQGNKPQSWPYEGSSAYRCRFDSHHTNRHSICRWAWLQSYRPDVHIQPINILVDANGNDTDRVRLVVAPFLNQGDIYTCMLGMFPLRGWLFDDINLIHVITHEMSKYLWLVRCFAALLVHVRPRFSDLAVSQ